MLKGAAAGDVLTRIADRRREAIQPPAAHAVPAIRRLLITAHAPSLAARRGQQNL